MIDFRLLKKQFCHKKFKMKKLLFSPLLFCALALFGQTLEGVNAEHLPATAPASESRFVKTLPVQRIKLSTGVELEYAEQGDPAGLPVLFLHGITDSWHSFETTLPHLPHSLRVFAISQRGHGNSERPQEGYTPQHFAADAAAFVQQKALGSVVIVGHSMGGVHALQFAIAHPELTKALVVLGADAVLKNNPGMDDFYKEIMKLKGAIPFDFMNEFQKATLAKPIDSAYFRLLVNEGLKTPARVFQAAFAGLMTVNFQPQLKTIKCPALLLWGDKDSFFSREGQERLAAGIKGAKLLVYKHAGHALHWEEPKRFAADLTAFIQQHNLQSNASAH